MLPIDFKLVTNNFYPKKKKKNNGIPKVKKNKIPCAQIGVSKPIGV